MNIPYTDTIFIGIIRMLLWILFLYILKRLFFKGKPSQNQVKTMGNFWAFYGSATLIVVYILVQFNGYDLLTVLAMMILFLGLRLAGFTDVELNGMAWLRRKQIILLGVIENVEDEDPIINIRRHKGKSRFGIKTEFLVATMACMAAMLMRFYLMQFDNYQLSAPWFQELNILKSIEDQQWFSPDMTMTGQYAFMSFYGLITGISTEMALESFALFQVFILCFVIFWFIDQMTNSLITIPLLASLMFALFFNLAPINVAQITHSKSTFMAMTFLLPAIVFIRKPWKLYKTKPKTYFPSMVALFAAIALIDIFTFLILIPPFFVVMIAIVRNTRWNFYFQALWAYVVGGGIIFLTYAYSAHVKEMDFWLFVRSNLLSITATTTTGNMILGYDTILAIYQVVSSVAIVIMTILFRRNRRKWASPLAFLVYVNVLILFSKSGFDYFDKDLFNEVLPVFIACSFGLVFYLIYYYFNTRVTRIRISDWFSAPLIFALFFGGAYFSQKSLLSQSGRTGQLSKNVLEAYQMIKASYIPYGYAVVNANNMLPMSKDSHNFISYDDFVDSYPERDSIYFEYKDDRDFLVRNTEYIVPNSLLVFVYDNVSVEFNSKITINPTLNQRVAGEIETLRQKGREIRLFFQKDNLKVFEIVNNPGQAKLEEML
ncbi:hypothetical protein [Roseivirga sp.]|uniref:hypothetical protein n=1 Tax=Roseivirga sp. TaxID=1964215 RepID=UPI003B52EEDC